MSKIDNLKTEINFIKSEDIKKDLVNMIENIPDYFFEIPASTTGKYHPSFALGEGGLLRHTKFAVRIAYDLLKLEMFKEKFDERQRDLILYALIIHDAFKCGMIKENYTKVEHPLISANEVIRISSLDEKEQIASMIRSHMGEWNKDYLGSEVLPKPQTEAEKFVHMCDYLASKKYLDTKFNGNELSQNIEEGYYVRS